MKLIRIKDKKGNIEIAVCKNKQSKSICLSVSPQGLISLTLPTFVTKTQITSFIGSHVEWIRNKLEKVRKIDPDILAFDREHYLKHKPEALRLVKNKAHQWSKFYNLKFNRLTIKAQKSRWGSCSTKKNLNFNYKIIFLEESLQDYLVVHEICHLKEMNHSKYFWNLVEKAILNHKEIRKKFRKLATGE